MKSIIDLYPGTRILREYSLILISVSLIIFTSCTSTTRPYSVLEFTGNAEVYNLSKSLYPILHKADSVNPTALMAGKGDLIMYGEKFLIRYRESSPSRFSIKTSQDSGFVNGKINSIIIPGNDSMIPWFRHIKSTDLTGLDFIYFDSQVSESYIPLLTELAGIRSDIGLGYDGNLKNIAGLLKIFKPGFIIGGSLPVKNFDLLSGLSDLEILAVSFSDSVYSIPLPAMPKLKQLIVSDVRKNAVLGQDLLINNKQLEKLKVAGSGKFDFAILKPLDNLKELIMDGSDTIENFNLIKNHKSLELLTLGGRTLKNDTILRDLGSIRWMTFYDYITQDEFNSFVENHPGLEVVEIFDNDTITSLQPLLKLSNLEGLTLSDTVTDFESVRSLKDLKYLSLPRKVLKDSTKRAEWQKALPGTRIVANEGFCLGSGWLLLIFPLTVAFIAIRRQKSSSSHGMNEAS